LSSVGTEFFLLLVKDIASELKIRKEYPLCLRLPPRGGGESGSNRVV